MHEILSVAGPIPDQSATAEAEIAAIRGLINNGCLSDAMTKCKTALAKFEEPELYLLLGYIAQQIRRYDVAIASCRRALALGLEDWSNYFILGLCLVALNDHSEALIAFDRAHRLSPQRLDVIISLLEVTVISRGIDAAAILYASLSAQVRHPQLTKAWARLNFEQGVDLTNPTSAGVVAGQMTGREWAESRGHKVLMVLGIEEIPIESPPVAGTDRNLFRTAISSNNPYVAELKDVIIFSKSNTVLTRDNCAINETGAHEKYGRYVSHRSDSAVIGQRGDRLLIQPKDFELKDLEAGIMLSGVASDAFGHWVSEYLPKLQFLEYHPDFRDLPVIVDENMPSSHYEYLSTIVQNRLVRLPFGQGLRVSKLIYAPPETFFPVHLLANDIPPCEVGPTTIRSYRYLKGRVESHVGTQAPSGRNYYLSRRLTSWRRLSNELEVIAYLEGEGYETIYAEQLSFVEQVRLFQSASSIIAANGSALQNLIFSDVSVNVFVLASSNLHNWGTFYGMMSALGYQSTFVCGEAVGDPSEKHADYVVPIATLEDALARRAK